MPTKREELKARLLARAEATIDKLLQDKRLHEQMTLSEIEQMIGQAEAEFRQAALEAMIDLQQETPTTCPQCAGALTNKGKRCRQVVSLWGETPIERTYYQCRVCGGEYFPPGSPTSAE